MLYPAYEKHETAFSSFSYFSIFDRLLVPVFFLPVCINLRGEMI